MPSAERLSEKSMEVIQVGKHENVIFMENVFFHLRTDWKVTSLACKELFRSMAHGQDLGDN